MALAVLFLVGVAGRGFQPESLLAMVPVFLRLRREAVYLSGAFEVLGPVGLLVPRFQRLGGWGLIASLVADFPANVNVAIHNLQIPGFRHRPWSSGCGCRSRSW